MGEHHGDKAEVHAHLVARKMQENSDKIHSLENKLGSEKRVITALAASERTMKVQLRTLSASERTTKAQLQALSQKVDNLHVIVRLFANRFNAQ
jgi:hypothetical protein